MRGLIALAALAAGCNSFLGVEDVTLGADGGELPDGGPTNADASIDGPVIDAPLQLTGIGFPDLFPNPVSFAADRLNLFKYQVEGGGDVRGLGLISQTSAGKVLVGIYGDDGGDPSRPNGSALAFVEIALDGAGENMSTELLPIFLDDQEVVWLGFLADQQTDMRESDQAGDITTLCTVDRDYSLGLPAVSGSNCLDSFPTNVIIYVAP